jgi:hypothetical protein
MSKKVCAVLAVVVLMIGIGAALAIAAEDSGTWTGEVVDVACLVAKGAHGAEHADCGSKCVKSGLPVGLMVGDTTYILIGAGHKVMNDSLAAYVGKNVTVTGTKYESKGTSVIEVKDFKTAKM